MEPSQSPEPETPSALRDALRLSPENIPLRIFLAEAERRNKRLEAAEDTYREGLRYHPGHEKLKLGLAQCFYEQKRFGEALVLVEDLAGSAGDATQRLLDLHIRLLVECGQTRQARGMYDRALVRFPSLSETDLPDFFGRPAHSLPAPLPLIQGQGQQSQGPVMVPRSYGDEMPDAYETDVDRPPIAFRDVGGLAELKEEIRMKIVYPLRRPEIFEAYDRKPGGTILLYGPPGCGKTHLARAAAGEIQAPFISIGINDVLDMWLGQSEKNLHDLFEQARIHRPCILFIDEVDAIGGHRAEQRQTGGRALINQLLAELDGADGNNEGILILAASSAPWHLDPAFQRPGRFDRRLFVGPPDAEAREAIFELELAGKPQLEDDLDLKLVVERTAGFSGADVKAVVDLAIERKLRLAMRRSLTPPLRTRDLLRAVRELQPTTGDWFRQADLAARQPGTAAFYAPVQKYLKSQK